MATIHISQAELERGVPGLVARLSEETSVVVENETGPVAMITAAPPKKLSLRERIALLPKHTKAVMDEDFARDVQDGLDNHREPLDSSLWD